MFKQTIYFQFFLLAMILLWTDCSIIGDGRNYSTFTVEVDSVHAPDEINSTDTLVVRPFGTVGPNGCHSFKKFEASRSSSALDLKVLGEVIEGPNIGCTDAIVTLDTTYQVPPPLEGPFEINIEQPDGSVLSRTVEIND